MPLNVPAGSGIKFSGPFACRNTAKPFRGPSRALLFCRRGIFFDDPPVQGRGLFADHFAVNAQPQAVRLTGVAQDKRHRNILRVFSAARVFSFQIFHGPVYHRGHKGMVTGGYALPLHNINIHKRRLLGSYIFSAGFPRAPHCVAG